MCILPWLAFVCISTVPVSYAEYSLRGLKTDILSPVINWGNFSTFHSVFLAEAKEMKHLPQANTDLKCCREKQ